jgi:hypothetical protein
MTTNVPQDVIDLVVEHAENGNWPEFDAAIELLRAQRQQGAEPDGELCDCTHTVNHCTDADNCRVVKKLVAYGKATHGLADTKATPPQANALVAAAYMKAAALLRERISPNDAMDEAEERLYDTLEKSAQIIEEAIPADAEAALLEYVRPYVEILKAAKCPNCDGSGAIPVETVRVGMGCCGMPNPDNSCCGNAIPIHEPDMEFQECQWCSERTAIVNSVLGEGKS